MHQHTSRRKQTTAARDAHAAAQPSRTIPNSAVPAHVSGGSCPGLEGAMQQKLDALLHQNPAAEQEADRMAQGVRGTSFEGVRAEMSQRLGADLSGVRVHTGAAAAEKADRIGAAAYTTGKDIYWGSGGFEPETMAHELVHTVQQGAVSGEASVMAPMTAHWSDMKGMVSMPIRWKN